MARARNIKPSFFCSEQVVSVAFEYRLLFAGLWTIADRSGRLQDRPKTIKMAIFPADEVDVEAGLLALHQAGLIVRYQNSEQSYIAIPAFSKHQNPHLREADSIIPAPDKHSAGIVLGTTKAVPSPADSLLPITDSLQSQVQTVGAKKTNGAHRGTRLAADWGLELEDGKWAETTYNLTIDQVIEQESRFRDYWISQPGAKGVKLDWPATWRNWVRRSQEGMR